MSHSDLVQRNNNGISLFSTKRWFNVESPSSPLSVFVRPLSSQEHHMKVAASDRRLTIRHNFRTPIRIRIWKSAIPEQRREALNMSQRGILFLTNLPSA